MFTSQATGIDFLFEWRCVGPPYLDNGCIWLTSLLAGRFHDVCTPAVRTGFSEFNFSSVSILDLVSSSLVAQSIYYYLVSACFPVFPNWSTNQNLQLAQIPHFGSTAPLGSVTPSVELRRVHVGVSHSYLPWTLGSSQRSVSYPRSLPPCKFSTCTKSILDLKYSPPLSSQAYFVHQLINGKFSLWMASFTLIGDS